MKPRLKNRGVAASSSAPVRLGTAERRSAATAKIKSASAIPTVWVGDITYVPTGEGWLYAAVLKDLCAPKIVGYAFASRIDTQLTLSALDMAVRCERPSPGLIFHSDRGIQHAAEAFQDRLAALGIRQSVSRKGDPCDNAVAENFFSCLKCELVHLRRCDSRRTAQADIFAYIEAFYNALPPHSANCDSSRFLPFLLSFFQEGLMLCSFQLHYTTKSELLPVSTGKLLAFLSCGVVQHLLNFVARDKLTNYCMRISAISQIPITPISR